MDKKSGSSFEYRKDDVNSSFGILAIRLAVGVPLAIVVAFIGNIFNGIMVPSPAAGDDFAFIFRMMVLGVSASTGGMVAWFNAFESKFGGVGLWAFGGFGGLIGGIIAYFVGGHFIDHPDLYILNQQLTQTVIFGAAIGSNVFAVAFSLYGSKRIS
ncbi:hypothetical protein [Candidatus Lucifugimonas marina]|uniref:Uncharacterized protein n=1 Tax=Candidatus Lucifugimonas marina TaxID=3038979 RepID=A0AAJ5ZEQ7_9CHLR|nr:hypothetical protein [SAR202 cluster bacterium JH702]MDG0870866.1 hypothetical protein [SAR202 cluster bacterium JH639]WFG34754.1 hypothetical protein GKN94_03350 [SAR202 cluster bacterium JH545]WFG38681.1 hypothetical protein GKO48_03355 [SAR202 cluster bacterium JH1073]